MQSVCTLKARACVRRTSHYGDGRRCPRCLSGISMIYGFVTNTAAHENSSTLLFRRTYRNFYTRCVRHSRVRSTHPSSFSMMTGQRVIYNPNRNVARPREAANACVSPASELRQATEPILIICRMLNCPYMTASVWPTLRVFYLGKYISIVRLGYSYSAYHLCSLHVGRHYRALARHIVVLKVSREAM